MGVFRCGRGLGVGGVMMLPMPLLYGSFIFFICTTAVGIHKAIDKHFFLYLQAEALFLYLIIEVCKSHHYRSRIK